jgi:hypothetical protein
VRAQSLPAPLPALLLSGQRSRVHLLTRHSGRSSSSGSSKALIAGDTASTTTSTAGSTRGSECLPPHSTMGGSSAASSSSAVTAPAVSFVPSGDCWVVLLVDKRWAATTDTDDTNTTATSTTEGFTLARATESASELAPAWLTRTGFRRAAHWSGVALTAPTALPPVPLEALPLQPFVRFCKGGVRVCLGSCATVGKHSSSSMKPPAAQYGVLVVAATEHESAVECDATDAEGKAGYVECSTN